MLLKIKFALIFKPAIVGTVALDRPLIKNKQQAMNNGWQAVSSAPLALNSPLNYAII